MSARTTRTPKDGRCMSSSHATRPLESATTPAGHDCGSCGVCPAELHSDAERELAPFHGATLVAVAAFYFILPIACAIVAAGCAAGSTDRRSLAAFVGLVGGLGVTTLTARYWTRHLAAREKHHG